MLCDFFIISLKTKNCEGYDLIPTKDLKLLLDERRDKTRCTIGIVLSSVKAIRPWKLRFAFIDIFEHKTQR